METVMDKRRLAAFADGELPPEEAAAVVLHLADHPGDQAYVDDLFAANAALSAAFAGPMAEPVPEAIRAAIMGETAVPAGATVLRFGPRPPAVAWVGGGAALAAGLAAAVFLLTGTPETRSLSPGLLAAGDGLAGLLETEAAGVPVVLDDGREAMVLATFALPDAGYCREIEVIDAAAARIDYAVACREAAGWSVRLTLSEGTGTGAATPGFATASGEEAQALMSLVDGAGTAIALDAAQEAEVLARGWTAP